MNEPDFKMAAKQAGFSKAQYEFMWEFMSQKPHTHNIEDVEGLEGALEELESDDEDDIDDEEE